MSSPRHARAPHPRPGARRAVGSAYGHTRPDQPARPGSRRATPERVAPLRVLLTQPRAARRRALPLESRPAHAHSVQRPGLDGRRALAFMSSLLLLVATVTGLAQPWQTALVIWFVCVVPGLAVLPRMGTADPLAGAVLTVAISVSVTAIACVVLAVIGILDAVTMTLILATAGIAGSLRGWRR